MANKEQGVGLSPQAEQLIFATNGEHSSFKSLFNQPELADLLEHLQKIEFFRPEADSSTMARALGMILMGQRLDQDHAVKSAILKHKVAGSSVVSEEIIGLMKEKYPRLDIYFKHRLESRQFRLDGKPSSGLTRANSRPDNVLSYRQYAEGVVDCRLFGIDDEVTGFSTADDLSKATKGHSTNPVSRFFRVRDSQE